MLLPHPRSDSSLRSFNLSNYLCASRVEERSRELRGITCGKLTPADLTFCKYFAWRRNSNNSSIAPNPDQMKLRNFLVILKSPLWIRFIDLARNSVTSIAFLLVIKCARSFYLKRKRLINSVTGNVSRVDTKTNEAGGGYRGGPTCPCPCTKQRHQHTTCHKYNGQVGRDNSRAWLVKNWRDWFDFN